MMASPLKWPSKDGVEFREIPNYPGYLAGSDGSIWSCWQSKWTEYRPLIGDARKLDGRLRYRLRASNGKYLAFYGSRLVLESFIGPCPEGMQCCHNDGNCLNDAISNLRWDTHQSNVDDKRKHGTIRRGKDVASAKLTEEDVREILASQGQLKQIAAKFGVTAALVSMIRKRKVWKHVK